MKRLTLGVFALFLFVTAVPAFAAAPAPGSWQAAGSAAFATGPDPFDDDFGLSFGAGYMLRDIENLQARIDVSYFSFDRDVLFVNVDYTRIPITISGRYYFPVAADLNVFAEAGIETSFDESEFVGVSGVKHSESEVNVGFTPGGGAEFMVGQNFGIFALGRFHVITDDYFSLHVGAVYHF